MNAWFFYILGFVSVIITRMAFSYQNAFFAIVGVVLLMVQIYALKYVGVNDKAKKFNIVVYLMLLISVSCAGVANYQSNEVNLFIALIHFVVTFIVLFITKIIRLREDGLIKIS